MAEWLFDKTGRPAAILDDDKVRSPEGIVIGWISDNNVYSLRGGHIGWHDRGVIYDENNCAIGFTTSATGPLRRDQGSLVARECLGLTARLAVQGSQALRGDLAVVNVQPEPQHVLRLRSTVVAARPTSRCTRRCAQPRVVPTKAVVSAFGHAYHSKQGAPEAK